MTDDAKSWSFLRGSIRPTKRLIDLMRRSSKACSGIFLDAYVDGAGFCIAASIVVKNEPASTSLKNRDRALCSRVASWTKDSMCLKLMRRFWWRLPGRQDSAFSEPGAC